MRKSLFLLSITLLAVSLAKGQTDADAFRYAGSSVTGTARFTAMSGAFTALGGDFSSISTNPAGLGIYRSNEFTLSPSLYSGGTESSYLNTVNNDSKFNFNFGNIGLVYNNPLTKDETSPGWKSWSFGLGYNRIHNFHNRSYFEAVNRENSLLDAFTQNAKGLNYDQLDSYYEYLAYYTYLINPDSSNDYTSVIPFAGEIQRRSSETRGSIGETVFSFAGNYSNKLFIGGSLNFRNLRYVEETIYEEADPDTAIPYFRSFQFEQNVTTKGNGFNLKFGLIYKANDIVRLGFSVHTPTWYSLRDEYNNTMSANLDTGRVQTAESPLGAFDYNYTTPMRVNAGIGLVIGQLGLVSADYDLTDYSTMRLSAGTGAFTAANNAIRKKYTAAQTIRIGTEWRYQAFAFRGGASFSTSPFESAYRVAGNDFSRKSYSAGIGIRDNAFFLDLGYIFTSSKEYFQPYTLNAPQTVQGVRNTVNTHNFVVTTGWKF